VRDDEKKALRGELPPLDHSFFKINDSIFNIFLTISLELQVSAESFKSGFIHTRSQCKEDEDDCKTCKPLYLARILLCEATSRKKKKKTKIKKYLICVWYKRL